MGTKRVVDVSFWTDEKVLNMFSPEDRLFMLYILTCPDSTQLGVFKLNPKVAAFHLGYSTETIMVLLDRFETKYGIIKRSKETNEVAIKNFLRYSILKGGKPVADLLNRDIKAVKDTSLLDYVFEGLVSSTNINSTVKDVVSSYYSATNFTKENLLIKGNDNINDNENRGTNRERIVEDDVVVPPQNDIFLLWEKNLSMVTPILGEKIRALIDEVGEAAVEQGIMAAVEHGARNFAYVQAAARGIAAGRTKPKANDNDWW